MKPNLPVAIIIGFFIVGVSWAGWLGYMHCTGTASITDRFDMVLLDSRVHLTGERPAQKNVVIVAIDDATVGNSNTNSIGRNRLARLVDLIRESGARTLAVDILLVSSSEEQADDRLAEALGSLPVVLAGAAQFSETDQPAALLAEASGELLPQRKFADAASVGFVNVSTDAGGIPRHVPMVVRLPNAIEPSFGLRAVGLYTGFTPSLTKEGVRIGDHNQPLDIGWYMPINYYGDSETIPTYSATDILQRRLDPDALRNKLVVLGVTATGVGDRFATPFDPIMPGVEVQATAIANLLDGTALIRNTAVRTVDVVAAVLITVLGLLALSFLPFALSTVTYVGLLLGWMVAIACMYTQGYWMNGALPIAASVPPVMSLALVRQVVDRYRTRSLTRAREALGRFQAPAMAMRIAEDPSFLLTPIVQNVAILFIDLSGYTSLSEQFGPARTRDVLKAFHTLVVNETNANNGVVLDFMGDGAMLGFGVPDESPCDAANACQCAFDLARSVGTWIQQAGLEKEISDVRVGGHFGQVVLSRLGHENQQQIAATGDCVNVASRLLEVAKSRQSSVVLSTELIDAAQISADDPISVQRVETSQIRGRQKDLRVGLWTSREIIASAAHPKAPGQTQSRKLH
ncbi:adenylate/guanylate cyclase domain-containing protein [Rhodobacterales bacterium]|nr:adenylate/guanylate cyclase domain-containing protein [Rhodobacterales bacterium]